MSAPLVWDWVATLCSLGWIGGLAWALLSRPVLRRPFFSVAFGGGRVATFAGFLLSGVLVLAIGSLALSGRPIPSSSSPSGLVMSLFVVGGVALVAQFGMRLFLLRFPRSRSVGRGPYGDHGGGDEMGGGSVAVPKPPLPTLPSEQSPLPEGSGVR